jgi:hypothetical protein
MQACSFILKIGRNPQLRRNDWKYDVVGRKWGVRMGTGLI